MRRAEKQGRKLPQAERVSQLTHEHVESQPPAVTDDAEADGFIQSTTWEGLEIVGGPRNWAEAPEKEADHYVSFLDLGYQGRLETREEFLAAIHQAVVELMSYKEAGELPSSVGDLVVQDDRALSIIKNTQVSLSKDNTSIKLQFPAGTNAQSIVTGEPDYNDEAAPEASSLEPSATAETTDAQYSDEADGASEDNGDLSLDRKDLFRDYPQQEESFLLFSLSDLETRFILAKRISYLTGRLIPDPVLSSLTTLSSVLDFLVEDAKPKLTKVADVLASNTTLLSLPNVTIKDRRQTWVDREKERGLWKVIEREIEERDLPRVGDSVSRSPTGLPGPPKIISDA